MDEKKATIKRNETGLPGWAQVIGKAICRLPLADKWHPWLRADKTNMRWLPINTDLELPGDTPVPVDLVDCLIEEASHRVLVNPCGCRKAYHCKNYPVDIGCLMMGDSALEISRYPFKEVGVEEAKEHARRAVDAGLVPVVGKARADNFIFGVKDRKRLLTVCFCCECCCVTRFTRLVPLKTIEPSFVKLDGISLEVTDRCEGCGACVKTCYIDAIRIEDGRAVIGPYCRACGRCASQCKKNAIEIRIEDPEFLDKAHERIRSYVTYE